MFSNTAQSSLMALSVSALLLSASVQADVTLHYSGDKNKSSMQVADGNMRMNFEQRGEEGYMLYDGAKDQVFMVNTDKQQYMELDKMVDQVGDMKSAMSDMISEQMSGMSAEDKARMDKMMGGLMGGLFGKKPKEKAAPAKTQIVRTGEIKTEGDFKCELIRVTTPQGQTNEACVTSTKAVGMSSQDAKTMNQMTKKMSAMGEKLGKLMGGRNAISGLSGGFEGVPVKTYDSSGMQLNSVDHKDISAEHMQIPANFKPMSMPSLG